MNSLGVESFPTQSASPEAIQQKGSTMGNQTQWTSDGWLANLHINIPLKGRIYLLDRL